MNNAAVPTVLLGACGGWHLPTTARGFEARGALAGLWISNKNGAGVSPQLFRRCWPFHLLMKPFYHLTPESCWVEKPFYALFPAWRLWVKRQAWPPCDVVHAIMGFGTEFFDRAGRRALKVLEAPNSHPTTYYGYWQRECDIWCPGEKVPLPRWAFARMNRELERADLVLCPSDFVRDTMLANGVPGAKCFVCPFGVDTSIFSKREKPPERPRFISVGMITLRKGHQYLFRAFEMVKREMPEAELVCVGGYRPDFRRERSKWEGSFIHYPHLPHAELAALLRTCTAFVFPSLEEGFARVIPEAMATGLPVIASYESGASTAVTDGAEGFIVRPRDARQIADAMLRLATDRGLNERMGEAAWRGATVQNTWQDYSDRLLAEYRRRL
ncbi:MAG: glycosyltransferase family 4 protein [Verrucomicrobiota bacterium]|nr:glycosyltransferase family 4 protein [Verrucomicrobiota bacterium]